jgi:hypothetical protein
MTTGDFKARITAIMRQRETGKQWSLVGGPRAHKCVLRKPQPKPIKKANQ